MKNAPLLIRHVRWLAKTALIFSGLAVVANSQAQSDASSTALLNRHIKAVWSPDGNSFVYRNQLPGQKKQYVRVDVREGTRLQAFDHEDLARKLRAQGVASAEAETLDLRRISFQAETLTFSCGGFDWSLDLDSLSLVKHQEDADSLEEWDPTPILRRASDATKQSGDETLIRFRNLRSQTVRLNWVYGEERVSFGELAPGSTRDQHTYSGHVWEATEPDGNPLGYFQGSDDPTLAIIGSERRQTRGSKPIESGSSEELPTSRKTGPTRPGQEQLPSPDGRWIASLENGCLCLRQTDPVERASGSATKIQLNQDPDSFFKHLEWAPDSRTLIAFQVTPGDEFVTHWIESSPDEGGRAKHSTRKYALPGDRFPTYRLVLLSVESGTSIEHSVEPIDFGRPRIRWNQDGRRFTFPKVDRGHQRFRLIEVDSHSGVHRTIVDESSDTFIWTAHRDHDAAPLLSWLSDGSRLIRESEQSGYRHLYLVNSDQGSETAITKGNWVVRGIDRIDETNEMIWFRASGIYPDQDPYFIHHCKIRFDGSDLVVLTNANGNHSIQFSPDQQHFIDTYSRVDCPPRHELRDSRDGSLVCHLESAQIVDRDEVGVPVKNAMSRLDPNSGLYPEVFVAKGRDGITDIWGYVCRPKDFDPEKKYPIIESIYAGPHGAHVPKSFRLTHQHHEFTDQGFVVVAIDGMGTAHRSKAFHDVCWQNLKDAGFPDRMRWIRAAAQKFPFMDIERVGIEGTSAGGQNAAAAVLFHGDFYRAAVASCGCHDNRMDKASWNEQWMGYPIGPQYEASSNVANAHRLTGKLFLMVGELDRNVPPESTLRFVDALIDADKDFDMLLLPGVGHSSGGSYGSRRRIEFFQRHLGGTASVK
ncbi:MAG: prolyl oligopeptidase family serine peptidase [Planctomycetota bacterium]